MQSYGKTLEKGWREGKSWKKGVKYSIFFTEVCNIMNSKW